MEFLQLNPQIPAEGKPALELDLLLKELGNRQIPEASINFINRKIEEINRSFLNGNLSRKKLLLGKNAILSHLEKNHNLVPENYYKNLWFPLGMSVFGLPIGVVMFITLDNPAFIGIGLPIGLGIGSFYGSHLDKKAEKEGRVINFAQQ